LLEKKKFPRDKHCGDAVCKTAIEILIDMGVYDRLIKENKAHVVRIVQENFIGINIPLYLGRFWRLGKPWRT